MKIPCYIKKYFLQVVFLTMSLYSLAQTFNSEIENYSIEDYNADNQNWGIDVDNQGVIYVANNKGLMRFNGQTWQLFELPNKTIVRSVLCVDNRIYTGSYEEFGYWTKDQYGNYKYTSLISMFDGARSFSNEQFWQIIHNNEDVFFKSFSGGVYVYDGNQVKYIEDSFGTYDMSVYNNKVLLANRYKGLMELKGEIMSPFNFLEKTSRFTSINNVATRSGMLFFYDLTNGGFLYNRDLEKASSLPMDLNTFLHKNILNKVTFLTDSKLAFGTIKKGIVIYDIVLKSTQYIHGESGIQNNTVLGIESHNGDLWVALDNGISKIDFNSPINFYKEYSGNLGTVYDVAFVNNNYYLGSNTGVYTFSGDEQLQLIEGSEDHVWDISVMGSDLIIGHNNGSYLLQKDKPLKKLSDKGVFCTVDIPNEKKAYLQGTYYGINFLKKQEEDWVSREIEGVSFLVNNIVFESRHIIWTSHPYKGVYRIELNEDYTEAIKIDYYGDYKSFHQYKTNIYEVNGSILFYNSNKWFQYFKEKDSIGLSSKFQKFNGKDFIGKENKGGWFIDRSEVEAITYFNDENKEILKIDATEIKNRTVSKYEKIIIKDDSLRILNLNNGFAIFNINELRKQKSVTIKAPVIDKVYSKRQQFSINDSILNFPFKDAQYLSFEIYTPEQYENNHLYTLSGKITQKELVKNGRLTLQNLDYGDYVLSLINIGLDSEDSAIKNFKFKVLPPWYLSITMRVIYFLLFIGVLFLVYRINKIKTRRQQLILKRAHIRETQKRINKLERENLEKEVKTKKRELTNSTDSIIRKNETIMVLLNELERLTDFSPNLSRTKKILAASKKDISSNNDWKVFESNFNELNQEFFKKLIAIQPKLTTKDLRLCAYIKTGLTSKKMAPLMGISLRGVELQRYRLRKKLDIPPNDNLASFLRRF